ncbi:MAG: hypothetical protein ACLR8P_08585 [Clostridium fessum]
MRHFCDLLNVLIQSSVNSFGSIAMAGNTASQKYRGTVYTSMNALYQTNLSFTSQNIGAEEIYADQKDFLPPLDMVVSPHSRTGAWICPGIPRRSVAVAGMIQKMPTLFPA